MTRSGRIMAVASRLPPAAPVDECLVDIGLDDREFHAGIVTKMLDIRSRARRRKNLQLDRGLRRHELREIGADREIGALLVRRNDLVVGRSHRELAAKAKNRRQRPDQFPDMSFPPLFCPGRAQPEGRNRF